MLRFQIVVFYNSLIPRFENTLVGRRESIHAVAEGGSDPSVCQIVCQRPDAVVKAARNDRNCSGKVVSRDGIEPSTRRLRERLATVRWYPRGLFVSPRPQFACSFVRRIPRGNGP